VSVSVGTIAIFVRVGILGRSVVGSCSRYKDNCSAAKVQRKKERKKEELRCPKEAGVN
jgi:hypothetical protein